MAALGEEGPSLGDNGVATDNTGQFWGDAGAGCLFVAEDTGRVLFSFRSAEVNEPHTWGVWGGAIDGDENPADAAIREAREELGYQGSMRLEKVYTYQKDGFKYTTYLAFVPTEFTPELDWETEDFAWIDQSFTAWPTPLHYGLKAAESAIQNRLRSFYRTLGEKRASVDAPRSDSFFQSFM